MKYTNDKIEKMLQNFGGESQIRSSLKARLMRADNPGPRRLAWGAALCICAAAAVFFIIHTPKAGIDEGIYPVVSADMVDSSLAGRLTMPAKIGPLIIDGEMLDKSFTGKIEK